MKSVMIWRRNSNDFGDNIRQEGERILRNDDYCCVATGGWPISKSSKSAVVSLTHLNAPQQHEKFLQFDFKEALTMRPKKAKNAPESVSQNGLLNSSYQVILLTYEWLI